MRHRLPAILALGLAGCVTAGDRTCEPAPTWSVLLDTSVDFQSVAPQLASALGALHLDGRFSARRPTA